MRDSGIVFDLIVIGGGINGSGIAREAALRGLAVCLLERDDFGGATTAASTRLIHGGLRYLQYGEIGLVRESLREREILLRMAPHLVRPLPFLLPVYSHSPYRPLLLTAGLQLYDWLAGPRFARCPRSLPGHRRVPRKEWNDREPHLEKEGLQALFHYFDAQVAYPERLCVENVLAAVEAGAEVANHTEVTELLRDGERVIGVVAHDRLTGERREVRGRVVVNASGPWVDALLRLGGPGLRPRIAAVKGSHLVVPMPDTGPRHAIYSAARRDGRPFFLVPWAGMLLIGTTEVKVAEPGPARREERCSSSDDFRGTPAEMEYLIAETNALFPALRLRPEDVAYTYAGLRPLPVADGPASRVTRRHFVVDHAKEGAPGLLSIVGGKITTYRALAEQAVEASLRSRCRVPSAGCRVPGAGCPAPGSSPRRPVAPSPRRPVAPLPGGDIADFDRFRADEIRAGQAVGLHEATAAHLVDLYGAHAARVRALVAADPSLARWLCPHSPAILAQVRYAVEAERARTLGDVLLRRTMVGLAPCLGRDAARSAACAMAPLLGWDEERVAREIAEYEAATRDRRGSNP
jgi:glycerol-3-phosphate dehydrogenase